MKYGVYLTIEQLRVLERLVGAALKDVDLMASFTTVEEDDLGNAHDVLADVLSKAEEVTRGG